MSLKFHHEVAAGAVCATWWMESWFSGGDFLRGHWAPRTPKVLSKVEHQLVQQGMEARQATRSTEKWTNLLEFPNLEFIHPWLDYYRIIITRTRPVLVDCSSISPCDVTLSRAQRRGCIIWSHFSIPIEIGVGHLEWPLLGGPWKLRYWCAFAMFIIGWPVNHRQLRSVPVELILGFHNLVGTLRWNSLDILIETRFYTYMCERISRSTSIFGAW